MTEAERILITLDERLATAGFVQASLRERPSSDATPTDASAALPPAAPQPE